ncbi:MAG: hypothetical protein R6X02_07195 [Enhygromyxa sp.]
MKHSRIALTVLMTAALLGCRDQPQPDIPNRVLDRPTDVALICAEVVCTDEDQDGVVEDHECLTQPLPLSACENETGVCTSDNPHLVGFVANSERNEIAMFTKCGNRLVDMNVDVPGYNFIPAGILPTDLDASADGCRVMSANVGSCDITVLDAIELARPGLGRELSVDSPSELVTTLVPRRFDPDEGWVPLGARPGEILSVPRSLTQAPGLDPDSPLAGICDPLARASVYVSFPTCNLVAEIDLQTGQVLQSRQFVGDQDGEVTLVDTGVSPICPVECPVQFDGLPDDLPPVDDDGPFPQALELALEPVEPVEQADPSDPSSGQAGFRFDAADEAVEGQSLFVGGLGSDIVFEIPISDTGQWEPVENQLRLSDASGIKRIRVSPAVDTPVLGASYAQFLYVIAGDGSTRVIGRGLPRDPNVLGVECETQLDPKVIPAGSELTCIPVSQVPAGERPVERRGLARGPGIRPTRGEEVTDWMFRKVYQGGEGLGPFAEPGTVAVGVTSVGTALYVMIDQRRVSGETTVEDLAGGGNIDPANVMDVRLFPHSQWPDPSFDTIAGLPLVGDEAPRRIVGADPGPTRSLAPTLRQIDATYTEDPRVFEQLDPIGDLDGLGGFYDKEAARVVVHDYRSWTGSEWTLQWEGTIQATRSNTGRISCANPGWEGGTCLVSDADDAQLVDASASFCDDGVLAGDKLVLLGCREDGQCGDGRRCLRESVAGGESTGICVSAEAYETRANQLREICANFISDPCGEAHREFTVTRAFQDRLWIQSMDQPLISYLESAATPCASGSNNQLIDGVCECLPGYAEEFCPGEDDPEVVDCCVDPSASAPPPAPIVEAEDRFICSEEQPDDGCSLDTECTALLGDEQPWRCIDGRCRRPCEGADECVFRRLPGPACFGEFVSYQVALRNQFRVSGPQAPFVTSRVEVGPEGECIETADDQRSRLLTSRLPLPASDDPDDPEWQKIPLCVDDTVEPGSPNPCRITASRSLAALFHTFEYEQERVSALRFSNPVFSIVLDLSALGFLTRDVPGYEGQSWPAEFARYRRSRIPRDYRQEFQIQGGYVPFGEFMTLEGRAVTLPVRIVPAPQPGVAFVVDASGPGTTTSIRGQVLRVFLTDQVQSDQAFTGVR